ncbi:uncharacterized protein LOC109710179 [Ananas comosus]|uniref:Uncharacterized protein LOC109710179 n=1 Tax=Ananas comosus TaxID=4615 RepID=A0A6P5EWQ8_ANACO|nr:uncharacterized protein LOC109710179 [Ananas comosus]
MLAKHQWQIADSRPKLVAGSPEGYSGHIDGRSREARLNHPKGFTVDDRGNIYVADTLNLAIRKISDTGVTTIAGGKSNRGGHVDGPSQDAKFSNDFDVLYVGSSCSLLIIDRGNQAIREIQLNFEDCAYQYETGFPLGVAVLLAAAFFGYMLALLQRRVGGIVSSEDGPQTPIQASMPPYQKPMKSSLRPPLIPTNDDEAEKLEHEEGFFSSIGRLLGGARSSATEIFRAIFRKKPAVNLYQQQKLRATKTWPVQDSFVIPDDELPPPLEVRTPTPKKNYAFMSKEPEKLHHIRHGRAYLNSWEGDSQQQKPLQQQMYHQQQHLQQHKQYSSGPRTFYEQSCETTNEIVFGAVQELDSKRRTVEIKAVNYGDTVYEQYGLRYRNNYMGCSNNY